MSSLKNRPVLACEIVASATMLPALAAIVRTCAHDLHQPITTHERATRTSSPVITVMLLAAHFLHPHQAWCLACRLACFCPQARVSVLVQGADAAAADVTRTTRERAA